MFRMGRGALIAAVVTVFLSSRSAEADIIGTPTDLGTAGSLSQSFSGTLGAGNDIALLFTFSVANGTTAEFNASLDAGGFLAVLTLFRAPANLMGNEVGFQIPSDPNATEYQFKGDSQYPATFASYTLLPGSYLLTLSQSPNLFEPFLSGFSAAADPGFLDEYGCEGFVDVEGFCGTNAYAGRVSTVATQPVPEPGTLSLLTLGATVAWRRRRIQQRKSGTLRHRPSS